MLRRLAHFGSLLCALALTTALVSLRGPALDAQANPRRHFGVVLPARATLRGNVPLAASGSEPNVRAVVFLIDGRHRWTATRRPFRYGRRGLLNTHMLRNGRHVVTVAAIGKHGRRLAVFRRWITVRNPAVSKPASRRARVASGARAVSAFGPPPGGVPGPSVALFNRETYQYSSALSVAQEAGGYQFIVLQATDARLVAGLHAANPGLKVLVYQHPWQAAPSDPGALHVCTSYGDDSANHPDWFLRGPDGSPLMTRGGGNYVMDIGNPGYRQTCVADMVGLAKRYGFDGVFIDDLPATWEWDLPSGATVPAYPTSASWQSAVSSFLSVAGPALHEAGLLAIGNLCGTTMTPGLWQAWSGPLDGAEEESWTDGGQGPAQQVPFWSAKLANVSWSEANGKYVLVHSYDTTQAGNDYGLASLLLVARGHSSYSTSNGNYTSYEATYSDYGVAGQLGAPAGPYSELPNGVLERAFSNGIVLVNPTRHGVPSFTLSGGFYSGSGLSNARKVTMRATSGLILLRVG